MKLFALAALLACGSASAEPALVGPAERISRNGVNSGGAVATGGGLTLSYAVGETAVAGAAGGAYQSDAGLVPMLAQPGTVTSIAAVSKSTGTLDLAWTAPGRDGAVGDVAGFWRIDYSSEPSHVFAPTTFVVELATSVSPGQPQSYQLTGLEPNTTYYTRVYLSDARKMVAETSAPSDESTFANVPVAPAFTGVFPTSVTISWLLPVGGAEGYAIDGSSTDFGSLFPGGVVYTTKTANGVAVNLTVTALKPATCYFFKLGSLNWQSERNYEAVISACTLPSDLLPITNLQLVGNNLNRTVLLSWTNPAITGPAGVTILVSTNPISFTPTDGVTYANGSVFPDGSIAATDAPTPTDTFLQNGLKLNVTAYFTLFTRNDQDSYSVGVSTEIVLDLPPMACAGLHGQLSVDGASITLRWAGVASNLDGSLFLAGLTGTPIPWELDHFDVYRATGVVRPTWVHIGTAPYSATSYLADVPVPGGMYFYKVVARDAFLGNLSDQAMAVDTLGAVYALGADGVSRLRLSPGASGMVKATGNSSGQPLLIRAKDRPGDLGGRIVKSLDFEPVSAPHNVEVPLIQAGPDATVVLRYEVAGGQVVPSAAGPAAAPPLVPAISIANAAEHLSAYFVGSNDAAKVYGRVDTLGQTVNLDTGLIGNYQIRSLLRDQEFAFDLSGVSNRVITPNGDNLNDTVVFTFDNQHDADVTGKIYDVRGGFVASMRQGPLGNDSLVWDGKADGRAVPQGVYIYQIRAEGKTFNGTVVVVK